jgi:hypothetical protein
VPDVFLISEGEQHFHSLSWSKNLETYQKNDLAKKRACSEEGFTLVEVPYWWDKTPDSLASILGEAAVS